MFGKQYFLLICYAPVPLTVKEIHGLVLLTAEIWQNWIHNLKKNPALKHTSVSVAFNKCDSAMHFKQNRKRNKKKQIQKLMHEVHL